jgi:hypothetical protein
MCGGKPTETVHVTPLVDCDLCALHKFEYFALISPYIKKGRAVVREPPPTSTEVRQWAQSRGMKVKPSGRIPQHIMEAYHAAHQRF